ncbi:hypothetical protein Tco_0843417 [Tanacetum coccineum]|uniref:Uncharacterized protein n=1 Tax=Tanacetum coccineum TaxID=301880 RepID=A0ABQ5B206_9ASTR
MVQTFHPIESEGDKIVPELTTGSLKRDAEVELDHKVEEVYVEALQVKYPIIDWEIYSEDTRRYWRIIRVGNHTEAYQTFDDMLKKFDRDDLDKLWSLVKERFSSTDPTNDKERTLWVELKRLFEPDTDDILWKLQRYMHDPLTWRRGLLGIKGFYKFLLLVQLSTAKTVTMEILLEPTSNKLLAGGLRDSI